MGVLETDIRISTWVLSEMDVSMVGHGCSGNRCEHTRSCGYVNADICMVLVMVKLPK